MPDVLLKILSIIGIILLVLLGILLAVLFLVLFVPSVYHADGRKDSESLVLHGRISWMFGFLRVVAWYSSRPGLGLTLKVKLLWFTLFDEDSVAVQNTGARKQTATAKDTSDKESTHSRLHTDTENASRSHSDVESSAFTGTASGTHEGRGGAGIYAKYEKIKYKIKTIYDNIKEKIKEVLENIAYYKAILEDKDTRALFNHVRVRFGRVLKALKPRKCKAEILFGTGSPDTTGYAFGVYGMLSPHLGNDIVVTPDFTRAVLEGHFAMSGHIMVFTILVQALSIILDKKFHLFMDKIKRR